MVSSVAVAWLELQGLGVAQGVSLYPCGGCDEQEAKKRGRIPPAPCLAASDETGLLRGEAP